MIIYCMLPQGFSNASPGKRYPAFRIDLFDCIEPHLLLMQYFLFSEYLTETALLHHHSAAHSRKSDWGFFRTGLPGQKIWTQI